MSRISTCGAAILLLLLSYSTGASQMAKVTHSAISGTCHDCKLSWVETTPFITRHLRIKEDTEVQVRLIQLRWGDEVVIQNPDGTSTTNRPLQKEVIDKTGWSVENIDDFNRYEYGGKLEGQPFPNPDGSNYGYFQVIGVMREVLEYDDEHYPVYADEKVFYRSKQVRLWCDGCEDEKDPPVGPGGAGYSAFHLRLASVRQFLFEKRRQGCGE